MALTFAQHLEVLGVDSAYLAQMTKLPEAVITRALAGQPIASGHADNIVKWLSYQHGLNEKNRLQPGDIQDLNVIDPESLRKPRKD